jgi:hypothetical protein
MGSGPPSEATSQNLAHALDAARAAIDAELSLAERLDEKARGQATLAGSWFAVTQAIAAISLTAHTHKCWIYGLIAGLGLQAAAFCLLLRASAKVWRLQTELGVGVESLRAMERDTALPASSFASQAITFYCAILERARTANAKRADFFDAEHGRARWLSASFWWWPVLIVGLLEITAALLSRVT